MIVNKPTDYQTAVIEFRRYEAMKWMKVHGVGRLDREPHWSARKRQAQVAQRAIDKHCGE